MVESVRFLHVPLNRHDDVVLHWMPVPPLYPPLPAAKPTAEDVIANVMSNMNYDDAGQEDAIAAALRKAGLLKDVTP